MRPIEQNGVAAQAVEHRISDPRTCRCGRRSETSRAGYLDTTGTPLDGHRPRCVGDSLATALKIQCDRPFFHMVRVILDTNDLVGAHGDRLGGAWSDRVPAFHGHRDDVIDALHAL